MMFFFIPLVFTILIVDAAFTESISFEMLRCYMTLQCTPSDSWSTVKSAHRRLVRKYHPDLNRSPDAEKKFIEVQGAYEHLCKVYADTKKYSKRA